MPRSQRAALGGPLIDSSAAFPTGVVCIVSIMKFLKRSVIAAPAEVVFGFHEAPDAFERLQPPWQKTQIIRPPSSLEVGTVVELRVKVGPLWQTMVAEHVVYEPGVRFVDELRRGPFKSWRHEHLVTCNGDGTSTLTDDITYELPLGVIGRAFGGFVARRNLERLFAYRHDVTRRVCETRVAA